jgi:hypothetical protein
MPKAFPEWSEELREIDAELIVLLRRRTKLALGLMARLNSKELSLGAIPMLTPRGSAFCSQPH